MDTAKHFLTSLMVGLPNNKTQYYTARALETSEENL
jgi:hypothetical protein